MNKNRIRFKPVRWCGAVLALTLATLATLPLGPARAATAAWPAGNGIGFQDGSSSAFGGLGVAQACTVDGSAGNISNALWFCTSANVAGVPRLTTLNALSDMLATAEQVKYFISTNSTTCTNIAAANTTNGFSVASTNGLVKGDFCLLRGLTNDAYQFLIVSNFLTTNVVLFYQTFTNGTGVGDVLYEMTQAGSFTPPSDALVGGSPKYTNGVASTIAANNPGGLFYGPEGKPLMVMVTSSNSSNLKLSVAGDYFLRLRR